MAEVGLGPEAVTDLVPELELEHRTAVGAAQGNADAAEQLIAGKDYTADKPADKQHILRAADNIVDTVADTTALVLAQQLELQLRPESWHLAAD